MRNGTPRLKRFLSQETKFVALGVTLKERTSIRSFFSLGYIYCRGWSGGAMVLGELPAPGRPTYLD